MVATAPQASTDRGTRASTSGTVDRSTVRAVSSGQCTDIAAQQRPNPRESTMTAPAAPTTTATSSTYGELHGTTKKFSADTYSAPNGYPAGPTYPAAPMAPVPPFVARSRTGVPLFIAGVTLWAIAVAHLMLLLFFNDTATT